MSARDVAGIPVLRHLKAADDQDALYGHRSGSVGTTDGVDSASDTSWQRNHCRAAYGPLLVKGAEIAHPLVSYFRERATKSIRHANDKESTPR